MAQPVNHRLQGAAGYNLRVKLFQRPRAGVAWIGKGLLLIGLSFLVQLVESVQSQVNLAADLEQRWGWAASRFEPQGDAADGPEVGGDIIPGGAVAACGADRQEPVLVTQADGDAIDLGLDNPFESMAGQETLDPVEELPGFFSGIGVVQAEHGLEMPDGAELAEGLTANPLAGRVRGDQIRERLLQLQQLVIEPVVLKVANGRLSLDVIEMIVATDLFHESGVARFGLSVRHNR